MHVNHKKYNVIISISISLLILAFLIMISPIEQLKMIYAAPAPTSGYSRGCVDAHIPDHAYRYINQPGLGPSFHSKAFMQAYTTGFDACSHNLNNSTVGHSSFVNWSAIAFVQKPYWSPTPLNLSTGFKQFHAILYRINTQNVYGVIQVCLKSEVDTHTSTGYVTNDGINPPLIIEHKGCTHINVEKALKTSGENVTLDAGYFIFPTWMAPKPPDIWMSACIKIQKVTTCMGYTQPANNPELVYMDMDEAYRDVFD